MVECMFSHPSCCPWMHRAGTEALYTTEPDAVSRAPVEQAAGEAELKITVSE